MKNPAIRLWSIALLAGVHACSSTANRPVPSPVPGPIQPGTETPSRNATPGGWTFHYARGLSNYRTTRIAAIEAPSDSGLHREISTNTTFESVSLDSGLGP